MLWTLLFVAHAADPDLTGTWTLAEDPAALSAKHAAAVEDAVSQLTWAFRPFARPTLERTVDNCAAIVVRLDAERFEAKCDADGNFVHMRADTAHVITGKDDKPYTVDFEVAEDRVTLKFNGDDGGQVSTYRAQPDGSMLLTKEIFSGYLARPVAWTARYVQK